MMNQGMHMTTRQQNMQLLRYLTCRVEGLGHKTFMDNFFSSPRFFDDSHRGIHAGQYGPTEKTCPTILDQNN